MYFHCWVRLHFQRAQFWSNMSKDKIIHDVLIPFINGQVIESTYEDEKYLMNLSSATHFRVFKTKEKITDKQMRKFTNTRKIGIPCTNEIVKDTHLDIATETAKSFIQKITQPTKKQIFVVMKFKDVELDSAYKCVIKPAGEKFGYKVFRIDDIEDSEKITDQILDSIARSEIIYADLTGRRPNCYFETAMAMALGRKIILAIKEGTDPEFDVQGYRFIKWASEAELDEKLERRLIEIRDRQEVGIIS